MLVKGNCWSIWSFLLRGRKKQIISLTILLIILMNAMFFVSLELYRVTAKRKDMTRNSANYGPNSYVENSGMRVIVGYYAGKANGKENLTDEEINTNRYSPIPGEGEMGRPVMMHQRELIRSKELFKLHSYNILAGDKIALNRSLPDKRSKSCVNKTYDVDHLPSASVIIIFHNEAWSTLMRTITSVIIRSPDKLLKEIIIVDDASTRRYLGAELEEAVSKLDRVRLLRQPARQGLVSARLAGARSAAGEVLVFLDSHCEVTEGWLEPMLDRAGSEDVFVSPHIDLISPETFAYAPAADQYLGVFSWRMHFQWAIPSEKVRDIMRTDPTRPYPTPAMAGGLFAVRKSLFWRLGGYDEGMKIWGGENLEMSWRAWLCGSRVEIAPCSKVAHVFRAMNPYTLPVKVVSNVARAVVVWLDDWADFFFKFDPEAAAVRDLQQVASRVELREKLKCKGFEWYLENVWPTHHFPTDARWFGRIRNDVRGCLFARSDHQAGQGQVFGAPCGPDGDLERLVLYTPEGLIVTNKMLCLESRNSTVVWAHCQEGISRQIWHQRGPRLKTPERLCLTLVSSDKEGTIDDLITTKPCIREDSGQIWHFERVPWR